jgi:hypothetical protein
VRCEQAFDLALGDPATPHNKDWHAGQIEHHWEVEGHGRRLATDNCTNLDRISRN